MNMPKSEIHSPSLDRPAEYQIILPGIVNEKWFLDYQLDGISSTTNREGNSYTYLTITVDQAALQGFLRYLYTLRLPLLSVKWIGPSSDV